jgi:iron complex outermembrane receptor protein
MFRNVHLTCVLTAGVSLLASTTGNAQTSAVTAESSAAAATSQPPEELSEVLVTAERRAISLQQAPMSVSAITADSLQASNITAP